MISHEHKCIFIHIPKCAGTSIESALGHLQDHTKEGGGPDHRSLRMIEQPWMTAKAFSTRDNFHEVLRRLRHRFRSHANPRNRLTVTKEQFLSYYKFTIVRNPWARAFSWYDNVMRSPIHRQHHYISSPLSLNEFLSRFAGRGMLRPQTHWIKSFDGSIGLDYIGTFETLAKDFHTVCSALGVPDTALPHFKKKGAQSDYREHYDEESVAIVSDVYKDEIRIFNYEFTSGM